MKKLAVSLALVALAVAGTASAEDADKTKDKPVDLKISIWLPPAHALVGAAKGWADDINKASGGSIKPAIFPSEQLGKAFDHYDMARDGIADVTYVNPGYQPGRFPLISAGQLPFTFSDANKGTAALDTWYRRHAAQEMADTHFCFAFMHDPGAYHGNKKVVAPTDLKGMKIRPAQSTIGQMVTALGGTNVQASAPEARDVLERGVADGIFFPWGSMFLFGLDKVTKYSMDVPLYTTVFTFSMNKAKYNAMSPAQKKVMDEHCSTEWAVKIATIWTAFEAAGRDKMRAVSGHEVYKLTAGDVTEWKTATAPLQNAWASAVTKVGGDADALWKEFRAEIDKNDAGM